MPKRPISQWRQPWVRAQAREARALEAAHGATYGEHPAFPDLTHMSDAYQAISDQVGGHEMDLNMARIFVASGEGNRAALVMRQRSTYWKGLIDREILKWLEVLNVLVSSVHHSHHHANNGVHVHPGPAPDDEQGADDLGIPHSVRLRMWKDREAAREQERCLRSYLQDAFGEDTATRAIKWIQMAAGSSPIRQTPGDAPVGAAQTPVLRFSADSVHAYIALAQWTCQVHAWCTYKDQLVGHFQGCCECGARLSDKNSLQLVPIGASTAPRHANLLVLTSPVCVDKQTVVLNLVSSAPLDQCKPPGQLRVRMNGDEPPWVNEPRHENMRLAKAMCHQVGIGAPFAAKELYNRARVAGDAAVTHLLYDHWVGSEHDVDRLMPGAPRRASKRARRLAGQVNDAAADADSSADDWAEFAVTRRDALLFANASFPPDFPTLDRVLGIDAHMMEWAFFEVSTARSRQKAEAARRRRLRREWLLEDFANQVNVTAYDSAHPGSGGGVFASQALERQHPGLGGVLDLVLDTIDCDATEHVLDVPLVRELVRLTGLMTGYLPLHDYERCKRHASPLAYSFVTGVYAGDLPNMSMNLVANRLNGDLLTLPSNLPEQQRLDRWEAVVRAMHVFDAVDWQHVSVRQTPKHIPASATPGSTWRTDASAQTEQQFEWCINLAGATLSGPLDLVVPQDWYAATHTRAVDRIANLGWNCTMPKPPSEALLRKAHLSNHSSHGFDQRAPHHTSEAALEDITVARRRVIDFVQVTAQQLICFRKTRAQGLEALTGGNLRAFIDATMSLGMETHVLSALGADTVTSHEEPEDDEDQEEEEGGDEGEGGPESGAMRVA